MKNREKTTTGRRLGKGREKPQQLTAESSFSAAEAARGRHSSGIIWGQDAGIFQPLAPNVVFLLYKGRPTG
jgi:hypothetical protein